MLKLIHAMIHRDLRLAMRRRADIVSALFFFILVVSLFPLGVGPEPDLLRKLAPGVLWVAALLSTMLSLPRLFADDHRDGTLEQLALSPQPLGLIVLGDLSVVILGCVQAAMLLAIIRSLKRQSGTTSRVVGPMLGATLLIFGLAGAIAYAARWGLPPW